MADSLAPPVSSVSHSRHALKRMDGGFAGEKCADGDLIRVNGQTGELTLLVDEAELAARQPHIPDLSASRVGTGREMFGALREKLSGAEQGATCITF